MPRDRLVGTALDSYLAEITAAVVREFSPERLILFGSFARGDQNRASDLDLVIIADAREPFVDRVGRALRACYLASKRLAVEALVYTPHEWEQMTRAGSSFASRVLEEGRILYERRPQPRGGKALAETGGS